jgi:hypothetical protein
MGLAPIQPADAGYAGSPYGPAAGGVCIASGRCCDRHYSWLAWQSPKYCWPVNSMQQRPQELMLSGATGFWAQTELWLLWKQSCGCRGRHPLCAETSSSVRWAPGTDGRGTAPACCWLVQAWTTGPVEQQLGADRLLCLHKVHTPQLLKRVWP